MGAYASQALRSDRDFVLAVVSQSGNALCDADFAFRNDKDVVLAAVRSSGYALYCASETLKDDEEVGRAVTEEFREFASKRLQKKIKDRCCCTIHADCLMYDETFLHESWTPTWTGWKKT